MKKTFLPLIISFLLSVTILAGKVCTAQNQSFGIYKVTTTPGNRTAMKEALEKAGLIPETRDKSVFVAYIPRNKDIDLESIQTEPGFKLLRTAETIDPENKYYGVILVTVSPAITSSDIHKTLVKEQSVEIRFTLAGAKKWASLTKNSTGHNVAFVMDDRVLDMPLINGEIKNGVARIDGFSSKEQAELLSGRLEKEKKE